jgi:hypothetical protein
MVDLYEWGFNLRGQHQTKWTPESEPKWILVRELGRMDEIHLQGGEAVVLCCHIDLTGAGDQMRRMICAFLILFLKIFPNLGKAKFQFTFNS